MNLFLKKFKKAVFYLEKAKFKVINKFHLYDYAIKRLEKQYNNLLAKTKNEEEKVKIISWYKRSLMLIKKENSRGENMNYHFNKDNPEETLYWLNLNKKLHSMGLKRNFIKILVEGLLLVLSKSNIFGAFGSIISILSILGLVKEGISIFINGSCIMLQNYNIDRVEKYIAGPYQKRKEKLNKKAMEYASLTQVTSKVIEQSESLPTPDEMLASLTTEQQKKLFLRLVMQELEYRKSNEQKVKVKTFSR